MDNDNLDQSLPIFIKIWFFLDFIICCTPPLYIAFGKSGDVPNLPLSIVYFIFCGVFITASIVAAEIVKA